MRKLTTEEFILWARKIHGDRYDYSKVDYVNSRTSVTIICKEHGEFQQKPEDHKSRQKRAGCPRCGIEKNTKARTGNKGTFIEKALEVHGDRYDYSKVEYVNARKKATITCKEHGEFDQVPDSHLRGSGCPKCGDKVTSDAKRITASAFIKKAHEVHGGRYNYSKVNYVDYITPITITCKEHGEFQQRPLHHASGNGCPSCGGTKKHDTESFIKRARETHGDLYDYSLVDYISNKHEVLIICKEHGVFSQNAMNHMVGAGCRKCKGKERLSTEQFIDRAIAVHGDRYDYSKVDYVNSTRVKVTITCKEHGDFDQLPCNHLAGNNCPKCSDRGHTNETFISKAKSIHGDKYDYSKVDIINVDTHVTITCKEHGDFDQAPQHHFRGTGCPKCTATGFNTSKDGCLYFLKSTCGKYLKIGISNKIEQRIKILHNKTPFKFTVLKVVKMKGEEVFKAEKFLHSINTNAGFKGFDGATEWFLIK